MAIGRPHVSAYLLQPLRSFAQYVADRGRPSIQEAVPLVPTRTSELCKAKPPASTGSRTGTSTKVAVIAFSVVSALAIYSLGP